MRTIRVSITTLLAILVLSAGAMAGMQDSTSGTGSDPCATATPQASPSSATPMVQAPSVTGTPAATPVAAEDCAAVGADDPVVVDIAFVDIAFVPATVTIPADTDVVFRFENKGSIVHNFKIDDPEVFSGDLMGQEVVELTVNLPAGEYTFHCTIPGHAESGMVGTLIVE